MGCERYFVPISFVDGCWPVPLASIPCWKDYRFFQDTDAHSHAKWGVWITNSDGLHFLIFDSKVKVAFFDRKSSSGRWFGSHRFSHHLGDYYVRSCDYIPPGGWPWPIWSCIDPLNIIIELVSPVLSYIGMLHVSVPHALIFFVHFQRWQ